MPGPSLTRVGVSISRIYLERAKVFSESAIMFLRSYRQPIIDRWFELSQANLKPDFVSAEWFSAEMLGRMYDQILDAVGNRHYRELNRSIETLTRAHSTPSPLDVKALLDLFGLSAREEHELREETVRDSRQIREDLGTIGQILRQVYSERLCPQLLAVVADHSEELRERWLRDLPTPRLSHHFSLLSEEDRQAFVDNTMAIYRDILRGRETETTPHPNEPERACTLYEAWLIREVNYFTPKGFSVVDVLIAIEHYVVLLEPLVARATAHDLFAYRVSMLLLDDARDQLARGFAEAHVDRFSREFYGEVGIMLHRIKNKLTSVPSTMHTVLAVESEEYGQMFDPMIMTVEEAKLWAEYDVLEQAVVDAAGAIDAEDPQAERLTALSVAREALDAFLGEHGPTIDTIRTIKLDPDNADIVWEMLNIVYEGGVQTQQLTEDLQVRMNELYERERPRWETLDIAALVNEAAREASVDARAKDINYVIDNEGAGLNIYGIRREIGRPFVQMIDNAIKYTPSGGDVTVRLQPDGSDHVLFSVQDTGIGIPPGEEENVFSLCERCSNAKDFAGGTGTGLYHDRITVSHHNGEMWVESPGLNQGSTFYIRLPIHAGSAPAQAQEAVASPAD